MTPIFLPCVLISFCFLITNPTDFENVCYHAAVIALGYIGGKLCCLNDRSKTKRNDDEEDDENSSHDYSNEQSCADSDGSDESSSDNSEESIKESVEYDDSSDEINHKHGQKCKTTKLASRDETAEPPCYVPRDIRGFTVYTHDAAIRVLDFYEWLDCQEPRDTSTQIGDFVSSKANIVGSIDHRRHLEEMLDKLYHDEFMWSLLSKQRKSDTMGCSAGVVEESSRGTALPDAMSKCRLNGSLDERDDVEVDLDSDGTSCLDISSQWSSLVRIIFIKILQIDFHLFEKIDVKQEKVYFVTHYIIPILGKYKDIYTSPDIFPFGTRHLYMRAVLNKLLEFINNHGLLEALILFACLWPELVQADCHPTINNDPTVKPNATIAVLKQDRHYGPLLPLIPSKCLDMFRE